MIRAVALLAALPALGQTHPVSDMIASDGLAIAADKLAANPDTATERFLLAGVTFLGAVEGVMQERHRIGATNGSILPVFRLDLPPNPAPDPFEPAAVARAFADLAEAGTEVAAILDELDGEVAAEIDLADLWFDIDADGTRDPGEDLTAFLGDALGFRGDALPTVRFDTADAHWLAAYGHLIAGVSEMVLAYDPTESIERVVASEVAFAQMAPVDALEFSGEWAQFIRILAIVVESLDQQPDAARLSSARTHLLEMVAQNRLFWAAVAAETDDAMEWIPNEDQSGALPIPYPAGMADAWLGVLGEIEAVLEGKLLVPHPRYWQTGINLARVFEEPAPIELIGWLHGVDALPYVEDGPLTTGEAWRSFQRLMGPGAGLIALQLN